MTMLTKKIPLISNVLVTLSLIKTFMNKNTY